ncbi:quinoprotein dehydrogenase-associated SoxYZ-like carrier [Neptuniibacter sp.]|uniref:quinoprotein dehydrogenase-associated SoxYZ-like carrier n=1 Tax=Neptuniibacter sp. TaxID=1962643 RepID=UPI002619C82D|nr:quinoprotein dehydrogenase-associated SoxYZ-like carrier [Neptuniibacter sp.]MCP4595826.1 quinoprotein dehydrogenase-associated SoxYZ-like carrier [Neptuniibacter sp.]
MKKQVAAVLLAALIPLGAQATEVDPLESPLWNSMRLLFIGEDKYVFDERVVVEVPEFAEDPTQVPITVNASALSGNIEKIVSFADLNPIQHIFTYYPHPEIVPRVSLRIKVQQGTAIRAAVLTKDGVWHIGGSYLDAAGGGCTTPSTGNANPYWESHLGETKSRFFPREEGGRYKFKVIHPMDTGLVDSIPEFYIEQVVVRSEAGKDLAKMDLSQPVSENPVITFDVRDKSHKYSVWMRDNGANEFETAL